MAPLKSHGFWKPKSCSPQSHFFHQSLRSPEKTWYVCMACSRLSSCTTSTCGAMRKIPRLAKMTRRSTDYRPTWRGCWSSTRALDLWCWRKNRIDLEKPGSRGAHCHPQAYWSNVLLWRESTTKRENSRNPRYPAIRAWSRSAEGKGVVFSLSPSVIQTRTKPRNQKTSKDQTEKNFEPKRPNRNKCEAKSPGIIAWISSIPHTGPWLLRSWSPLSGPANCRLSCHFCRSGCRMCGNSCSHWWQEPEPGNNKKNQEDSRTVGQMYVFSLNVLCFF